MLRCLLFALLIIAASPEALAQNAIAADDREAVRRAVLDYARALYEADPSLVERSVSPDLVKLGYARRGPDGSGPYVQAAMSYAELRALAATWNRDQRRVDPDSALRRVTVFDVLDRTAAARLDAEWGTDYFHLHRDDGRWQIVHVLWQSPPDERSYPTDRAPDVLPRISSAEAESGRSGLVAVDYPGGSPEARYTVVDGQAEGVWVEWYPSGIPRYIGEWSEGRGHGVWTYFHESGAIRERTGVVDDVWHGRSEGWHPNGERAYSGTLRWGQRDGVWRFWNEDGSLDRVEAYRDGQRAQ